MRRNKIAQIGAETHFRNLIIRFFVHLHQTRADIGRKSANPTSSPRCIYGMKPEHTQTHLLLITAFLCSVDALKTSGHTISKHTRIEKIGRTPDNGKYAKSSVYLAGAKRGTCSNDFRPFANGEQVWIIHIGRRTVGARV